MDKKILFLTNARSPNPGNWALFEGTKNLIGNFVHERFKTEIFAWDDITFQDSIFPESFFEQVNQAQLLWIIGAVTFNGRKEHSLGGSRFNLDSRQLDKIKIPMVLGGVSYRFWEHQRYFNKEALVKATSYLLERDNCVYGVRNDGTKPWLETIVNFSSKRILEFPDPGFFALDSLKFENHMPKGLILSLNNEDASSRFQGFTETKIASKYCDSTAASCSKRSGLL